MRSALPSSTRGTTSRRAASVAASAAAGTKHVVITGANTGIGLEAALALAQKGGYSLTLACRDDAKAAAAVQRVKATAPGVEVEALHLDLSDLNSVGDAAKALLDSGRPIDVLLNNAGVMACPYMETKQGFEYQFGVNHLGHYHFTTSLLPKIKENPNPARIINVASAAHQFAPKGIDFGSFRKPANYSPWPFYGQSKLANILFTYELARRLPGPGAPTANALHPGVVRTELGRYMVGGESSFLTKLMWQLMTPFTKAPADGALTSIYLCSSPEVEGVSGKYYDNCRPISSSPVSYDTDMAKKLFDVSAELVESTVGAAKAVA